MNLHADDFAEMVVDTIKLALQGPLVQGRFESLEQRIAALEAKPHVKFCGVWKAGTSYQPGDAATHHGGLWICKTATSGEPSQDFVGWTLAVKQGAAR